MIQSVVRNAPMTGVGLSALPQSWIAMGKSHGSISTSIASGDVKVERGADLLILDATNPVYPDLTCVDLGQGKVKLVVDMPWPVKDLTLSGPMGAEGDRVVLKDDDGAGVCELSQPQPGQVRGVIREAGVDKVWFLYEARV